MKRFFFYILFFYLFAFRLSAQEEYSPYSEKGDSLLLIILPDVPVYPKKEFKSERETLAYRKLVRDVKKTLPLAKMIYATLIETYEYIETLPDEKTRQRHLKQMEDDLFEQYKPVLKKMTLSQGKLLIRLVDRECNQSSFHLVEAFLGSFRANFWNLFAGMFGASLKSEWDPDGKDAETEKVVRLVEAGIL